VNGTTWNPSETLHTTILKWFELVWTLLAAALTVFSVVFMIFQGFEALGSAVSARAGIGDFPRSPAGISEIFEGFPKDLGRFQRIFKGSGRSWEELGGFSRISASPASRQPIESIGIS